MSKEKDKTQREMIEELYCVVVKGHQVDGRDSVIYKVNKHDKWFNYVFGILALFTFLGSTGIVYAAINLVK